MVLTTVLMKISNQSDKVETSRIQVSSRSDDFLGRRKTKRQEFARSLPDCLSETENDQYLGWTALQSSGNANVLGMSLRELVFTFRHQTLVMFKCCLLQAKVLAELVCMS